MRVPPIDFPRFPALYPMCTLDRRCFDFSKPTPADADEAEMGPSSRPNGLVVPHYDDIYKRPSEAQTGSKNGRGDDFFVRLFQTANSGTIIPPCKLMHGASEGPSPKPLHGGSPARLSPLKKERMPSPSPAENGSDFRIPRRVLPLGDTNL